MFLRIFSAFLLVVASSLANASTRDLRVEFAYRNPSEPSATSRRVVSIQGERNTAAATLAKECGATGANCTCDFFRSSFDAKPVTATQVGLSAQSNSFSCAIPALITDSQIDANLIRFVKLKKIGSDAKKTRLTAVRTTLSLENVLGSRLAKTKVRGVFRNSCSRTFFEGEGVNPYQITCVAGQKLGVIAAHYSFYTYRSAEDRNDSGSDAAFDADICGRNSFLKIQCTGNVPELRYGFYKHSVEPFIVGITMTRAPEGENLTANYGFAALPDSAGNCPPGLVKLRSWVAQPASITEGSLDGVNPPSNFMNGNNSLNNTVIEQLQPQNFPVWRQANAVPCAVDGNCSAAQFQMPALAQSASYVPITPVVCAIPPALLNGIF